MCDRQILYGKKKLASTIAVIASFVMIAGCATTGTKPQETSEATAPQLSEAEQLAANLNDKAEARRQKGDVAYRDPRVHSVNGTQQRLVSEQNQALYPGAPTAAPSDTPASIAGLVTQPTGVNASRSSIFSAPPPIAVNPDGTLAKTQPDGAQAITPMMRSVYSTPPTAMQTMAPQAMDATGAPNGRTSADMLPPPVIRNANSPAANSGQPVVQAGPSGVVATPNPNVRVLNSKQAGILAQFVASKNQPQNGKLLVQPVQGASGQ